MRFEVICSLLLAVVFATPAEARKSKRRGFNFGTSLRMVEIEQPSSVLNHDNENSRTSSEFHSIKPFMGYAFGNVISIGAAAVIEEEIREGLIDGINETQKIERDVKSNFAGGSLFFKLLFGRVMFLETGVGYFQRNTNISTMHIEEYPDSSFTGTQEEKKITTAGPGYYLGGGVELPIAYGFFFTTNYRMNFYNLKPYKTEASLVKTGDEKSKEISFGLAHYFR